MIAMHVVSLQRRGREQRRAGGVGSLLVGTLILIPRTGTNFLAFAYVRLYANLVAVAACSSTQHFPRKFTESSLQNFEGTLFTIHLLQAIATVCINASMRLCMGVIHV